jgi:uncharacterized protein YegL
VAFVLDSSGSMLDIKQKAIDAYNEQLQTLRKESGADINTMVSLTTFSDFVNVGSVKPLPTVEELNETSYQPNGLTALFDAIGETTLKVAKRYRDDYTNAAVLMVIITDGKENASMKFRQDKIKSMVKELEGTGRWTFTFLAANQNPLETAVRGMGLHQGNVMNFMATNDGYQEGATAVASGLSGTLDMRRKGYTQTSSFYNPDEDEDE